MCSCQKHLLSQLKIRAFYVGNFLPSQGFNRGKEESINMRSPRKGRWKQRTNVQSMSNSLQRTCAICKYSRGNCQGQASSVQRYECCIFRKHQPALLEVGCPLFCSSGMAQEYSRKDPLSSKHLICVRCYPRFLTFIIQSSE